MLNLKSILALPALLVLGVASITVFFVVDSFNSKIQDNEAVNQETKELSERATGSLPVTFDWIVLAAYISVVVTTLISSYYVRINAALGVVSFLLLVLVTAIPMLFSDYWTSFTAAEGVAEAANEFPVTDFLMTYYPFLNLGVGALAVFAGVTAR